MIHVFTGTKAQYIKMAPLLRCMDAAGVAYRLIDSGQHATLAASPVAQRAAYVRRRGRPVRGRRR